MACLILLVASLPVRAQTNTDGAAGTLIGDASLHAKWVEGLRLAQSGSFDKAARQLEAILAGGVKDGRVEKVNQWLHELADLQAARRERAEKDYRRYVEWVQADIEGHRKDGRRGWWRLAVLDSARAYNSAPDREAFIKEPWFQTVVEGATKAAAEYEEKHEWLAAARIYGPLADMLPQKKELKRALERCQAHIRLELMYSPESDWENAVKNIFPGMAKDAFLKIEELYLNEPSFKDAAIAGLEQMLRLARTEKLKKTFPGLNNADNVEDFCDRLEVRLEQVRNADGLDAEGLITIFDRVLTINREIDLLPQTVVIYEFVHGALQPLDPFSDMLWPADILEFNKHTQGRFSGVGIQIRKGPGEPIKVVSPLDDTPAYRKGIQPGDQITEINGEPTDKITINEAVRRITGPPGTTVTLTIKRVGVDKPFQVKLERQEITIFTIKGFERKEDGHWNYMIAPEQGIAYVRMTNFTERTIDELKDVLKQLRDQEKMRGLIFDLRGNPGGPLKAAVDVTDLFLDGNKKIVSTKDRGGQMWSKSSTDDAKFSDFPLIILIDETTASASEIVSGALQIHKRALILGERSYGKGSVQQVLPLNRSNMAFLKLTTAHYYLPNGRCLHREEDATTWGVDPDVHVRLVPKEFVRMNELRLKKDILKGRNQSSLSEDELKAVTDYSNTNKEADESAKESDESEETKPAETDSDEVDESKLDPPRKDENDFPAIDPQLEVALSLMRIRLESGLDWLQPDTEQIARTPGDPIAATPAAAAK
ncbi:MAG TPA: S41 family peptidase [Phycisphaerae bacterium]|nr:S41 family peptidase [Phycisphaerae bacterium]HOQ85445.1 S41 family peptidase [Phycisphaerae bacterium]